MVPLAFFCQGGMAFCAFSFVSTLIGTDPSAALFRGCGGLTGSDNAAGVSNSGSAVIESITKTANNGEFLVTMSVPQGHAYRYLLHGDATVWSPQAGPGDGYEAHISDPANEGSGRTTQITFLVTIVNGAGTPAELDARRVSVELIWKISGSGA
jgi:hypothetical protein